jgi:DNA-binding response OmpR family regulator
VTDRHKVLVVDDDPQIRKILERILDSTRYHVVSASEGASALIQFREFAPQLVILDIMMPGVSGIEVCQQLRKDFPERKFQVLMLSAKDSQADRRRALEYGADDYVTKPFHIASLTRKIEYIFEKKGKEDAIAS